MITKKEVEHTARLARIELTEEEKAKFEKELSAILEFVEKLNEVDTGNVMPLSGGTSLKNIMRKDVPFSQPDIENANEILKSAPSIKERWVRVRAVFE